MAVAVVVAAAVAAAAGAGAADVLDELHYLEGLAASQIARLVLDASGLVGDERME